MRQGVCDRGFDEGPRRGARGRHLDRGFGLGLQDMLGCGVGDAEQGSRLVWIGCKCSPVLWYLLPWVST